MRLFEMPRSTTIASASLATMVSVGYASTFGAGMSPRPTSDNNRKARIYTLTRKGRKELAHEEGEWRRIASAIMRAPGPASE